MEILKLLRGLPAPAKETQLFVPGKDPLTITVDSVNKLIPDTAVHEIAFIDGGQGDLMVTASVCLSLARVAAVTYDHLSKKRSCLSSFYLLVRSVPGERLSFRADLVTLEDGCGIAKEAQKLFRTLRIPVFSGKTHMTADAAASFFRRMLELICVKTQACELKTGSMVVLDGHLDSQRPEEKELLKAIEDGSGGVLCAALAKKTNMVTASGHAVVSMLSDVEGCWCCTPEGQSGTPQLSFVRLHPKSEFVFKFHMLSSEKNIDVKRIVASLAAHSKDPVFPGYPYGLIKADQLARVSEREAEYQKNLVIARLGRDWKKLKGRLDIPDAHSILDSIA